MSVVGLDLVTADGELVHASPDENADLYWAARGAGPGFFGVVVRFHLRVYPKPRIIGFAVHTYPLDALEDVFRWAHAVGPEVPASVELQLMMSRRATRVGGPGIEVLAPVFADSLHGALADLAFLNRGPVSKNAALKLPFVPAPMSLLYRAAMQYCPDGTRWSVDNMWTSAPLDALLPALRRIAETLPPPPSFMTWLNWAPPRDRPDMAFSMEDNIYITLYGGWRSAADDARYSTWAEDHMREMQPLASGCNLADENLGQRPARFVSDEHLARLDRIRAARDPDNRFYPWMGRPAR
jgi:FAD/FMN-containing dehydrogenase